MCMYRIRESKHVVRVSSQPISKKSCIVMKSHSLERRMHMSLNPIVISYLRVTMLFFLIKENLKHHIYYNYKFVAVNFKLYPFFVFYNRQTTYLLYDKISEKLNMLDDSLSLANAYVMLMHFWNYAWLCITCLIVIFIQLYWNTLYDIIFTQLYWNNSYR